MEKREKLRRRCGAVQPSTNVETQFDAMQRTKRCRE
jgi:hypothetical protein